MNWRKRVESAMIGNGAPSMVSVELPDGEIKTLSKIKVKCIIHGTYETTISSFYGSGSFNCKKCSSARVAKSQRKTREHRIEDFKKVHGDLYDYSLVPVRLKNNKVKIKIICSKHGVFEQRSVDHSKGHGCRYCTKNSPNKSYVLGVYNGDNIIALKYGVTKSHKRRFYDIQKGTSYKIVILGVWSFDNSKNCIDAENEIKSKTSPVMSRVDFKEGYTETCSAYMLDEIFKIFKIHGGIR